MLPTRRALRHSDEVVFTPRQEREAHEKLDKQTGAVRHAEHKGTVLRKRAHPNARGPATHYFRTTTFCTANVVSLVLVLAKTTDVVRTDDGLESAPLREHGRPWGTSVVAVLSLSRCDLERWMINRFFPPSLLQ